MPIYDYRCGKCKAEMQIVRTVAEMEQPPTEAEMPKPADPPCPHEWERFIAGRRFKHYGDSWGTRKGYH